jgi:hypothetical protein
MTKGEEHVHPTTVNARNGFHATNAHAPSARDHEREGADHQRAAA